METRIKDFAYYLPGNRLTNEGLSALNPGWDIDRIELKTGIRIRYLCDPDETPLDMGVTACRRLLDANPGLHDKIDAILFCTTTSDYVFPKNAYILHHRLGFPHSVFCLDIGLTCSGFVYSIAVAKGLITAGVAKNVMIITSEALSKFNNDHDRATKTLFSDGACATWVTVSDSEHRVLDMDFGSQGKGYDAAYVPAGRCRTPISAHTKKITKDGSGNIKTLEQTHLDGKKLMVLVGSHIPRQVKKVMKRNNLSMEDIDLFVFHQGSKLVLDALERRLRIPPEKHFWNYDTIGNTSSASIPIALKDARDRGRLHPGHWVLISGFGAGFSWGTVVFKY